MDHSSRQENHTKTKPNSNSDLMSSAKVLVDAAKSAYSKDGDKIDKARVAGATADFLGAAKHYGKFEEKSFGKYVDKAESCLQNYHSSSATPTTTAHGGDGGKHGHGPSSGGGSGGGYGEYVKLAQGLLNKEGHGAGEGGSGGNGHSSSSGGGGGDGSGEYIKLAQGLMNKGKHGGASGGDGGGHGGSSSSDYIKLAQGLMKKH